MTAIKRKGKKEEKSFKSASTEREIKRKKEIRA